MKFEIGTGVECDLEVLLRSRLLIQAMSGAGKSWLIRRILEQTFPHVQHFIFDSEGDFKTLREKFPYLLVAAEGGDIEAAVETAGVLAEKLLGLSVPTILDISGLASGEDGGERAAFVAAFLRGLLDTPPRLWHDALVVLDEAQLFAPQGYQVASRQAVSDAAGLVRKRGFGLIIATNRLAELNKTVCAHLANKLIGRSMGIDADRAARELGLRRQEARGLQTLEDGDFYAFGPAISKQVVQVHVGPVETTHPTPGGDRTLPTPPTSAKVKAIVAELAVLRREEIPSEEEKQPARVRDTAAAAGAETKRLREQVVELEKSRAGLDEKLKRVQAIQATTQADFEAGVEANRAGLALKEALLEFVGVKAAPVDVDAVTEAVLARLPDGTQPIQVTPPEALRKRHLEAAVERVYGQVEALGPDARRVMELLLGQDRSFTVNEISQALSGNTGGNTRKKWGIAGAEVHKLSLVVKGSHGYKAAIGRSLELALAPHGPTPDELAAVEAQVVYRLVETG